LLKDNGQKILQTMTIDGYILALGIYTKYNEIKK